jgi:hypothetical protein
MKGVPRLFTDLTLVDYWHKNSKGAATGLYIHNTYSWFANFPATSVVSRQQVECERMLAISSWSTNVGFVLTSEREAITEGSVSVGVV